MVALVLTTGILGVPLSEPKAIEANVYSLYQRASYPSSLGDCQ
jgi:hypothetical protein